MLKSWLRTHGCVLRILEGERGRGTDGVRAGGYKLPAFSHASALGNGGGYRRVWGILLLTVVMALAACQRSPREVTPLRVGVVAPFGGRYASLGERVQEGVLLAVEDQLADGGVLGAPVELVLKDSGCDFAHGREAARAVLEEKTSFILGAVCSNASEAVAQIAMAQGVLQITPASTDPELTLDANRAVRPLVFRVPPTDPDQGRAAAWFAREQLGVQRAALLIPTDSLYGTSLADAFAAVFGEGGGEIVAREAYDPTEELFFDALDVVRDAEPDVLYVPGYARTVNALLAQARSYGLTQPVIGSDGWDSSELDLGVADGTYFTTQYAPEEPLTLVREWSARYQVRYGRSPDALAALSYDAARLLFAAINGAGSADPWAIAAYLEDIRYEGVTGSLSFDEQHNPVRTIIILQISEGRRRFVGRFPTRAPEVP